MMKIPSTSAGTAAFCVFFVGISASAIAQTGALKVTSYPSGAQVAIDGLATGKVTPMSASLPVGDHTVTVQIPGGGWNVDTRTVTIVSGNNDLSVTLLPTLTMGPQGPPGPPGASALSVVDGNGNRVGPYLNIDGTDFVLLQVGGQWLRVIARTTGLNQSNVQGGDFGFRYFYPTSDCSGTPYYLMPGSPTAITPRQGALSGTTILYAAEPFQIMTVMSNLIPTGTDLSSPGTCFSGNPFITSVRVGTAAVADISDVPNTAPFAVR